MHAARIGSESIVAAMATVASPSASCSRINVNPSRLCGLTVRLGSLEGFAELGASEADAHDDHWVDRACDQIRGVQFGVLQLPQPYVDIYRRLIDPSSYPPVMCEPGRRREEQLIPITELPPRLVGLSAIWAAVCECICAAVTRELEARMRATPLVHPTGASHGERRQGMLRITIDSFSGPHLDSSYTTMIGTGNVLGALQLQNGWQESSGEEQEPRFAPCEDFVRGGADGGGDETSPPFFLFTGTKLGEATSEVCRPLRHQASVPPKLERCLVTPRRLNVVYFLRHFTSCCGSLEGDAVVLDRSEASLEINAPGQKCIVSHQKLIQWPPPHLDLEARPISLEDEEQPDARSDWEVIRDDGVAALDWLSGDGLWGEEDPSD